MKRFFIFCLGFSCAEPFRTDRHHLDAFRILEASVHEGVADAVIWSGEGAFHTVSPQLQWLVNGEVVAQGFGAAVPPAEDYELEVLAPSGDLYFADVASGDLLPQFEISRFVWNEQADQEYAIEHRSDVSLEEKTVAEHNDVVRLKTGLEDNAFRHRWSADGGTILELSSSSTDVFFDTLRFEEDELILREEGQKDRIHVFLLTIDERGGTATQWVDVDFSGEDIPIYHQMMLPISEPLESGLVQLDVLKTEDGYRLENPTVLDSPPQEPSHICMPRAIFDIRWIRQGRCSLRSLDGLSIVLEVP